MEKIFTDYKIQLNKAFNKEHLKEIEFLASSLEKTWDNQQNIYICGNGGSAANANHIANDLIYGAGKVKGKGLKIESLAANSSVITCLANDIDYENIFSEQIKVKGKKDDILIALSGSGNSKNIVNAINQANDLDMKTFAILGYNGGECKKIAKYVIHTQIDDMQICEDMQMIIFNMCMKWLSLEKN